MPAQKIDLTKPQSGGLEYAEVHTPAGVIRVNTGLVDAQSGVPVVLVEVEPNTRYRRHTAPGGSWRAAASDLHLPDRLDVRLVRDGDSEPGLPVRSERVERDVILGREIDGRVNGTDADRLRKWLSQPNGSLRLGRVCFEAVSGGGILVRTSYRVAR